MNWLGEALMTLFPPKDEPASIMSDDMKRYKRYLGPRNSVRYNANMMEMQRPGSTAWERIPTLAEWLAEHPQTGVTPP